MGPIPPHMPMDELDREMLEVSKARRAAGGPAYSSSRVRKLLADLRARFEQAGWADPAIMDELLTELRAEVPL